MLIADTPLIGKTYRINPEEDEGIQININAGYIFLPKKARIVIDGKVKSGIPHSEAVYITVIEGGEEHAGKIGFLLASQYKRIYKYG